MLGFTKKCFLFAIPTLITMATLPAWGEPKTIPGKYIVTLDKTIDPYQVTSEHKLNSSRHFHHAINGFATSLSESARKKLLTDPRVIAIEPDQVITANDIQASPTWGLDRVDQRALPLDGSYTYVISASGVTAYVIDTGINFTHNEFGGRATFGFDAFGGNGVDCNGHGTHVAGSIGGLTYGVAKSVNLVAVRVLDCNGSGSTSGVIAGIDWVTRNHVSAAVANLSLGGGISVALDQALLNMINSGVATVVAAGNEGRDACAGSPSRVSAAMTIGAASSTDAKPSWSNYGSCVDWFAPGVSITSAWIGSNSALNTISGTSMATPHTAGAAALYLAAHPTAKPIEVRDALLSFSTKNKISLASSSNNHMLHSLEMASGSGDYISPSIALTNPAVSPTVVARRSNLTLTAAASDNVGVKKVEFYLNGSLTCTDTVAPYSCNWKTPSYAATVNWYSKAYDAANNIGSTQIVTVKVQ